MAMHQDNLPPLQDPAFLEMMELFDEQNYWQRLKAMFAGFRKPRDSREYKFARTELQRQLAPAAAILIPSIGIALLACRRIWLSARRMSSRAKGQNQLVELGQIAAGLAHELKNPLSTINLNLKLLVEDLGVFRDEAHARAIRRLDGVRDEARRLNDILGDFLRFAGKHELQLSPVDLRSVLDELADFFNPQTQAAQVVLRLSTPDVPVICMIDANLLKQAVLNLMINARQAMPGGGRLLIKLAYDAENDLVDLVVRDFGCGIPADKLPHIFDPFYSTKSGPDASGKGGSGLGLSMCRDIIEAHHGRIRVDSSPGVGTAITLKIPSVTRAAKNRPAPRAAIGPMTLPINTVSAPVS